MTTYHFWVILSKHTVGLPPVSGAERPSCAHSHPIGHALHAHSCALSESPIRCSDVTHPERDVPLAYTREIEALLSSHAACDSARRIFRCGSALSMQAAKLA